MINNKWLNLTRGSALTKTLQWSAIIISLQYLDVAGNETFGCDTTELSLCMYHYESQSYNAPICAYEFFKNVKTWNNGHFFLPRGSKQCRVKL